MGRHSAEQDRVEAIVVSARAPLADEDPGVGAMHEDDTPGYWALMFWQVRGLDEKDAARVVGQMLAARYDETAHDLPLAIGDLLARLNAAEKSGQVKGLRKPRPPGR